MLAKAVANEANVPFLSMAGSEFIEMIGKEEDEVCVLVFVYVCVCCSLFVSSFTHSLNDPTILLSYPVSRPSISVRKTCRCEQCYEGSGRKERRCSNFRKHRLKHFFLVARFNHLSGYARWFGCVTGSKPVHGGQEASARHHFHR